MATGNKPRPCPRCKENNHDSKGDHLWLMKDGETWACFKKEYHSDGKAYLERGGESYSNKSESSRETLDEIYRFPLYTPISYRSLRSDAFKSFNVRCSYDEETGEVAYLYFPIHSKGELVGYHRRSLKEKAFINIGSVAGRELDLFGLEKCQKTGKNIIITEGHLDALSVYQIIKDKYPKYEPNVASLNNGTGSIRELANCINELQGYDNILLCFDMDKPGRDAVAKAAKILGSKVRVMELSVKDANEALTSGKSQEVINAIFHPKEYIPSDIVTLYDIYDQILIETPSGTPFPWEGLNQLTFGIFSRQIISVAAAAGSGKTVFMNQLSAYLIKEFKTKVALFSLEETPAYTAKKLIGSLIHKRIHLPGIKVTPEEIEEEVKNLNNYLYIYDTQGFLSWDDIRNNIRYLASLGCKIFIIDPLTAVTAMYSASEANEVLNAMMAELSGIVQSLDITVFLVSHLNNPKTGKMHSEGGRVVGEQLSGSRAMTRWSHLILGLERNLLADDEKERDTMTVRVIKNRLSGKTGVVSLIYNQDTGVLEEEDIPYDLP